MPRSQTHAQDRRGSRHVRYVRRAQTRSAWRVDDGTLPWRLSEQPVLGLLGRGGATLSPCWSNRTVANKHRLLRLACFQVSQPHLVARTRAAPTVPTRTEVTLKDDACTALCIPEVKAPVVTPEAVIP
jgi:hypothetical protein